MPEGDGTDPQGRGNGWQMGLIVSSGGGGLAAGSSAAATGNNRS